MYGNVWVWCFFPKRLQQKKLGKGVERGRGGYMFIP